MDEKQTILVVEDEIINRIILKKLLSREYNIIEAENGREALEIIKKDSASISTVLLDIVMPVMDGYEVLQQLRQEHMDDIPVIVMTAEKDSATEHRALDEGAWDFVTKPFDERVLLIRISNAIARSKLAFYEKIKYLSEYDSLTGLYNRAKLLTETSRLVLSMPSQEFVFLRVDIDHFALFNSSFGEQEGDQLLCYFAGILSDWAAEYSEHVCGRITADIFCLCIPYGRNRKKLEDEVEKVQKMLDQYPRDYLLKMSVGVYIIEQKELSAEEFYLRASLGAQSCKNRYGVNIAFYDAAFGNRVTAEMMIANEMQAALDNEQFLVYLQPKYRLSDDTACGAEALVRWQHPVRGMISPAEFIPVFEGNGFISKVDYYVWEKTCQMLRFWLNQGKQPFPVSVNISRISLYNPQLVSLLLELVERYQIAASLLELEITESAYMSDQDQMQDTIHALRTAGFTILMDDFGSGYSSLNTLKTIEVDILKIDMKFLPTGMELERGEIILASVIRMANWIGMSVIVEGVETRRQRDFIEAAGCNCVQGYYYSKPISREEYEKRYVFTEQRKTEQVQQAQEETEKAWILAIDDSRYDRKILEHCLKKNFHLHLCDSAERGLIYLKKNKNRVKLILVDNEMPGMSGLDFIRYCKLDMSLQAIPKIIITSGEDTETQIQALHAGAYDFISKPLIEEVFFARVNHIMEIHEQEMKLLMEGQKYHAQTELDQITGLLNKAAFQEECVQSMVRHPEEKKALMVIDVDDFQTINELYGSVTGDRILRIIADELMTSIRKTDTLGRFGGDEFIVLMTSFPNIDVAKRKAEDILKTITFSCAEQLHIDIGISIGIASYVSEDSFDTLFARADQALFDAKNNGKARVMVYGEKVPPISDDDKPLVVICGENHQLFSSIALAYGCSAAFLHIDNLEEMKEAFGRYRERIRSVCLDMQAKTKMNLDEIYQFLLTQGGGRSIPLLAVCREGNMKQLAQALELEVLDILTIPPQADMIQRRLSRSIMLGINQKRAAAITE